LPNSDDQSAVCDLPVAETPTQSAAAGSKILIVVVRYGTLLEESETIRTLGDCMVQDAELARHFSTLVWDNTPVAQSIAGLPIPIEYRHSGENVGVAGAYNYALEVAEQRGFAWLLLLDQDTKLPPGFLAAMRGYASRLESDASIAAVAPTVLMGDVPVSPKILSRWGGAKDPRRALRDVFSTSSSS
jgi:GT2 family glycosyltransferase